ncbi:ribonuclease R [Singulisphaera acidiphila]|uniref:Ribonuclease R n=1 Tax=Singulisphaera acidiphila (strain ATCC BAA-1392 / DSM 18658 / VKM B-2454 / MOB10) TaxID=886293 RepID=L0DA55_SINAD|nr:ribonuclease R [Singulisphaera acidiphila]AGA25526.1 ribonuclease R [Singulisphaera acidiphila DSM 18658]
MTDPTDKVLDLVSEADYKPMTLKAMSRRLGIDPEDYPAFRAAVKGLIKDGRLEIAKDKRLSKPHTKGTIIGLFRRSAKGFGFVRPHTSKEKTDQIYIPVDQSRDASSGDEVAVKITKRPKGPRMNVEGRIVQILARASGIFVGTYFEELGAGFVRVDGTTFGAPIYVGDPGAKGAKPADKVAIEMVSYPTPYAAGEGVISEILGPRGQPGVDTLGVIRAFNIPDTFDEETLSEARKLGKQFSETEIGERLDLRTTLTVTIDPATARDFDDAITLSRDDRGFWSLGVHIADVSHFVQPGSDLDRTARQRGTSVYLPDRVIPMLPEVISNSLASLQAGKVRYTVSALLEFNADGIRTGLSFARSAIKVDHRFSYEQAITVMKEPEAEHEGVTPEVARMLGAMLELAQILRRRRFERGALELNMPAVEVDLGDQGEVVGAHLASNDESHQVIEDFMLAANEAVATFLTEKHAGFLRRTHADPEPTKLDAFAEFARSLGLEIENPQSRFELQRILIETAGKPEEYAVHYGVLRSLKQAVYTPEPEGHFALASENYCHFTSPIRRYPDLQVHRQLTTLLEGKRPKSDHDELTVLADHCTKTERRAEAAERELVKIKLLTYLESRIGESFQAIIIGVEEFGLFCRIVNLPVDGLVHITSLADDYYYLEFETHTLIGRRSGRRYRLGDRIEVRITRIDIDRRELDLAPAEVLEAESRPKRSEATPSTPEARRARPPASSLAKAARSKPSPKDSKKKTKNGKRGKGKGKQPKG